MDKLAAYDLLLEDHPLWNKEASNSHAARMAKLKEIRSLVEAGGTGNLSKALKLVKEKKYLPPPPPPKTK